MSESQNLFALAAQAKYRFMSISGNITVEDLYDLPLESNRGPSLDDTAQRIAAKLEVAGKKSFVRSKASGNPERQKLENMLAIVQYIIAEKEAEQDAANDAANKKALRQQLLELKQRKQLAQLEGKSVEEIDAMLTQLQ
jgi:hypothetical protein